MNKTLHLFFVITFCWGCASNSTTEKHQHKRDNIINVYDKIKEIVIEDIFINNASWPQIIDNYLFIKDHISVDELIHIFDKNNYKYITSTGLKGQGPGEIANIGHIAEDKINRKFYVSDYSKYKIFSYDLDSVITIPAYLPIEKKKIGEQLFPSNYIYINDTLAIGVIIQPIGNNNFTPVVGKFNMKTVEITLMNYTHPKIKKKRIYFAISMDHDIYVECYIPHDLLTICNLDGDLKYNIYGPNWDTETHGKDYYGHVEFCGNRIVALYSGEKSFTKEGKTFLPTKFIIFDLEGNYLKTLETGYQIVRFCYDKDNHRIILSMDDDIQFGYLDMEEFLD